MKLIVLLITILATTKGQNSDLCPFRCTCKDKNVTCKSLTSFPVGLPENVEELVFDVSTFSDFKQNAMRNLINLKTFSVINSNFSTIHSCSISNLKSLTKLEFSNIKIGQIVSNGFSNLNGIKEFLLNKVVIQMMDKYAFNDIKNVEKFEMDHVVVANMDNYAFHSWSNIRLMQFKNISVLTMKPRPFQEFNDIDRLEITGGVYPSSMCGMKDIIQNESVKKIKLQNNVIICSCNMAWVFQIQRDPKRIDVVNNTCARSNIDVLKVNPATLCKEHELPECINTKRRIPNCQTYTMDSPIMPGDTVQYPNLREIHEGNHVSMVSMVTTNWYLLICAIATLWV